MKKLLTILLAVLCYVQASAHTLYYYHTGDYKHAVWYWYTGEEGTWSDWMSPVSGHDNWYSVDIPSDYENVIFVTFDQSVSTLNWNDKVSQTADLVYDGVNAYYYDFWGWQSGFDVSHDFDCTESGKLGTNIQWCYDGATHALTITGSGEMGGLGITMVSNREEITSISISEGITSICNDAFYGCSGLTSATIPNSVTSIGDYAFYGCTGLTSVTIPDCVTYIGSEAFNGVQNVIYNGTASGSPWGASNVIAAIASGTCGDNLTWVLDNEGTLTIIGTGEMTDWSSISDVPWYEYREQMKSVIISDGVTSIGSHAFYDCTGLTSVTIPNSVTSIGITAFWDCTGLTSVTIPNSVTSIGSAAFSYCTGLTGIIVEKENTMYDSRDNCNAIIETATNTLISGCKNTVIPNSVTSIGGLAFNHCSGLTSITIPNSVTSIGYNAFYDCSGLTSVTIPNSVTSIGEYAYAYCSGLTSVTIPNSVTSIGSAAFSHCTGLTGIIVEKENTMYDSRDNCNAIIETATNTLISGCKNTVIPNSVTSIGGLAFNHCTGLTSITIPNSVTSIGSSAFSHCTGLTSITIPNSVTSISSFAFSDCTGLTSITIPNSVTSIEYEAFRDCTGLTSVAIPNSVTSIESGAFEDCSGLLNVNFLSSTPPRILKRSFNNIAENCIFTVPCDSKDAYVETLTACDNIEASQIVERPSYNFTYSVVVTDESLGSVTITDAPCDAPTISFRADAAEGYVFSHWSDGNTENPRTITLTQDTVLTAEFGMEPGADCEHAIPLDFGYDIYGMANVVIPSGDRWYEINIDQLLELAEHADMQFIYEIYENLSDSANNITFTYYEYCNEVQLFDSVTFSIEASQTYEPERRITRNILMPYSHMTLKCHIVCDADFNWGYYAPPGADGYDCPDEMPSAPEVTIPQVTITAGENLEGTGLDELDLDREEHWIAYGMLEISLDGEDFRALDWSEPINSYDVKIRVRYVTNCGYSLYSDAVAITVKSSFDPEHPTDPSKFMLELTAEPEDLGTVVNGGLHPQKQEVTFSAVPNEGSRFIGWSDGAPDATRTIMLLCDTAFTAYFEPDEYTVTFVNHDNTVLQQSPVKTGDMPEYTGPTPVRESNDSHAFTFAGWEPEIVPVVASATYTAVYDSIAFPDTVYISDAKDLSEMFVGPVTRVIAQETADITISAPVTVRSLTLHVSGGSAPSVDNLENLTADVIDMVLRLEPEKDEAVPSKWYAFGVPFAVPLSSHFRSEDSMEPAVMFSQYVIDEYDGALCAAKSNGWKRVEAGATLKPGNAYMISVNGTGNEWRLTKQGGSPVSDSDAVSVTYHASSIGAHHAGWNGIANPRWTSAYASMPGLEYATIYHNVFSVYETLPLDESAFANACPLFVQTAEDGTVNFSAADNGGRLPVRSGMGNQYGDVRLTLSLTDNGIPYTDKAYLTLSDEADGVQYTIGGDLEKMMTANAAVPQLWISAYGTSLAAHVMPPIAAMTLPIGLYAPEQGEYTFGVSGIPSGMEIMLTHDGSTVWNLTLGQCQLDLNAGDNEGYAIIIKTQDDIVTGVESREFDAKGQKPLKFVKDGIIYIQMPDGTLFDARGKTLKK